MGKWGFRSSSPEDKIHPFHFWIAFNQSFNFAHIHLNHADQILDGILPGAF
ncbi:hypothetical protein C943_02230 [Mariniradius saccharolyticus AK6]|uniref:Uncharacterized protein n=1 Tax=Mariniradius saccharolyticus AK6 TaxID=1239962 RepID=M7X250_9BACT|nr:hypothetical protein C943_02230 [Mariniradius saccharolyticus AK6]